MTSRHPFAILGRRYPSRTRKDDHDVTRNETLEHNDKNIVEFRANGGRIGDFGDAPVLLLTTIGAKSGKSRTSPMMYQADEQDPRRVYVFASAAGADANPAWFHNIVAHPQELDVEIGTQKQKADAEVLTEPDRTKRYAIQADRYPGFAAYQEQTTRRIPVVALDLRW
jgi:deazaflavin-dependent oxidoreductase (nitroreductase family)